MEHVPGSARCSRNSGSASAAHTHHRLGSQGCRLDIPWPTAKCFSPVPVSIAISKTTTTTKKAATKKSCFPSPCTESWCATYSGRPAGQSAVYINSFHGSFPLPPLTKLPPPAHLLPVSKPPSFEAIASSARRRRRRRGEGRRRGASWTRS
jgi:hypothetical protein